MQIFKSIIGNLSDSEWQERKSRSSVEYIPLKEWQAQRSRLLVESDVGRQYAITLPRHTTVKDGDILYADSSHIIAIHLSLSQIMTIDMSQVKTLPPEQIISASVELGHALGNQHWPAVVKGEKVYVPLAVDRRVMESVMQTHRFEHLSYSFSAAEELLPHLSPSEVRRLLGSSDAHSHAHSHAHHEHQCE